MKKTILIISLSSIFIFTSCKFTAPSRVLKLWYNKPATVWEEALPIGNGRLGAMVFGGVSEEHIQFNEETLWTGRPHDYAHKGASKHLKKIRELLWAGKQREAENLASKHFMSVPLTQENYQPFGDLKIISSGHKYDSIRYRRELDISNAVVKVDYSTGGVSYSREYIASNPDNAIVIRYSANKKGKINFQVKLSAEHESSIVRSIGEDVLELKVGVKEGALFGTGRVKVIPSGGRVRAEGKTLHVEGANSAVLYLVAATNFVSPKDVSGDPDKDCDRYLASLSGKRYAEVKKAHISDYKEYFDRFEIDLGTSGKEHLTMDKRVKEVLKGMDNSLAALYVQYGRYLMLSCSRKNTYPANLQGIWNKDLKPAWGSKYTVNINTEMNYWPAEPLNIAECHYALFAMLEEVAVSGSIVAKEHYNARGWVLHHNTDIWRGAAPINASNHGIWVTGGAWLSHHLWEHYLYEEDKEFLKTRAWPIIRGAALFFTDFLVEDPKTGWLISTPSNSPETGGLAAGPTMDHQIIKSLFEISIKCSDILGTDKMFADTLKLLLPKIAPHQIGKHGQLQEWVDDIDDPNNHHRHVSHLWGVHPGSELSWRDTPELMRAARKSLIYRGDEGTGWSLAWKINFWARLRDGNHAWHMVRMLLSPAQHPGRSVRGGSYPNLFDAHPPFQIDGNFGGAAGIVEMLVQSHLGEIELLPALPDDIQDGHIRGLRARGGFEVDLRWLKNEIDEVKIVSNTGHQLNLRYGKKFVSLETTKGGVYRFDKELSRL